MGRGEWDLANWDYWKNAFCVVIGDKTSTHVELVIIIKTEQEHSKKCRRHITWNLNVKQICYLGVKVSLKKDHEHEVNPVQYLVLLWNQSQFNHISSVFCPAYLQGLRKSLWPDSLANINPIYLLVKEDNSSEKNKYWIIYYRKYLMVTQ